ncbi:hypothetical protein ACMZ9T_27305, partial [Klebsiella pneumoniae]
DAIVRFPAPVGGRLPVAQQIIRRFYRQRMNESKKTGGDAAAETATENERREAEQREAADDRARMARGGRPGTAGGPGTPDTGGPPASSPA